MKSGSQVYISKILKVSSTDLEQVVEILAGERQRSAYHAMSVDDWWLSESGINGHGFDSPDIFLSHLENLKEFCFTSQKQNNFFMAKFHVFALTYSIPFSLILI